MLPINEKVISIIRDNIDYQGEIYLNDNLYEDLEIDSFEKLMIINALEDEFSLEIDEEVIMSLSTISDVVENLKQVLNLQ